MATEQPKNGPNRKRSDRESDDQLVKANIDRLAYAKRVGHDEYVNQARINERFYLGGGLQWSDADRAARNAKGKPCLELNHVLPAVNSALGLQLHSRVDIDFQPRGDGADAATATVLSKIVRQICDQQEYHWKESQVYEDGEIQQRGYFDIRMDFTQNVMGDIHIDFIDPLDGYPDPDAQSYDPAGWADFTQAKWMRYDDIAVMYGEDLAGKVEQAGTDYIDGSGEDEYRDRSHFGKDADGSGGDVLWVKEQNGDINTRLYYVIDRQYRQVQKEKIMVTTTGEKIPVDTLSEQQIAKMLQEGASELTVLMPSYKWTVTCGSVVLFNGKSPYRTMTVVPYFPIFRRGQTRGMVDNLIGPQELENKSLTNYLEIWNSAANSGFVFEENSIVNYTTGELEEYGSMNGLVLEIRKGYQLPQKLQPNQIPVGAERLVDRAEYAIKTISGMNDSIQGSRGREVSGVAIESKQFQGQMQQGRAMDNLALTRRLVARKILELIQQFYTDERVFRIVDPDTQKMTEEVTINEVDAMGEVLNNVTVGRYDVVVTDTPTHPTFRQSQFEQTMAMVEKGIQIRPSRVVLSSTLADRHEIATEIEQDSQQQGTPDPVAESTVALNQARAGLVSAQQAKTEAETVSTTVESQYSAIQTAGVIAATPQTAIIADEIYASAGGVDHNAPPVFPGAPGGAAPVDQMLPPNTNPLTPVPPAEPASPVVGMNEGIETQRIEEA